MTGHGPSRADRARPTRPRVAIIHDDPELLDLLRALLAQTHLVRTVTGAESMTLIAGHKPSILVVGPLRGTGGSPNSWDIIALARAQRALRQIPIVLLSADLDGLIADGEQIAQFAGVHVIGMPFDLDVLLGVIKTVERDVRHIATAPAGAAADTLILSRPA